MALLLPQAVVQYQIQGIIQRRRLPEQTSLWFKGGMHDCFCSESGNHVFKNNNNNMDSIIYLCSLDLKSSLLHSVSVIGIVKYLQL